MKKTLDSNTIKLLAIAEITADHIAWLVYPGYPKEIIQLAIHIAGQITCPAMCYFIAESYHHTKNINRYTARLFVFAFISHFAYVYASAKYIDIRSFIPFYYGDILDQTSVMWSLAWGLVMLRIADSEKISRKMKIAAVIVICIVTLPSDWSCIASLCIMAFGTNRGDFGKQMFWLMFYTSLYSVVYFFAIDSVYGIVQMAVVLSIPLLKMYNGKRSGSRRMNRIMKQMFYVYYPLHLSVIGILRSLY